MQVPFGSTTHYQLLYLLEQVFRVLEDVTVIDVKPGDLQKRWDDGEIDG